MDLNLDLQRFRRRGLPEAVLASHKSVEEIVAAAIGLAEANQPTLVTRASPDALAALATALPHGRIWQRGGCFTANEPSPRINEHVAVISGGTSDAPVVDECLATLTTAGVRHQRFGDCGVAGLQRLLNRLEDLQQASVIIAVAGMEAALPTVLTGLVGVPVIGCPTSVGYGVSADGTTALQSMLASCAGGLTVVNIDNGFGAATAATTIIRQIAGK
jgi:NCAIR mutase (PurE)-related protein